MGIESSVALGAGHLLYDALKRFLSKHGFDEFVETLRQLCYSVGAGGPSLAPAMYSRLLLIG